MQRTFPPRPWRTGPPRSWVWSLTAALTLAVIAPPAALLFDAATPIDSFPERAIGLSTWMGIDASGYAGTYVRLIATTTTLACLLLVALSWLDGRLREGPSPRNVEPELSTSGHLALVAATVILLGLVAPRFGSWSLGIVCLALSGLALLVAVVRQRLADDSATGSRQRLDGLLQQRALLTCAALLPVPIYYLICLFSRARLAPIELGLVRGLTLYLVVFALSALGLRTLTKALETTALGDGLGTRARPRAAASYSVVAASLLLWLPATGVAANELQYFLQEWSPRRLAALAAGVWILATLTISSLVVRRGRVPRPSRALSLLGYPSLVATAAVIKAHVHVRVLPVLDYFHKGEQVVPTQQLFEFGMVPFFDLRPVHTLSDMTYQTLYATFAGTERALDLLVWEGWVPAVVGIVLLYFLLLRMAGPLVAVALCVCLPVLALAEPYYGPALIVPIAFAAVLERPTTLRWWGFAVAWFCVALWRIDFGLAATAATVGVAGVHSLRHGLGWLRGCWRPFAVTGAAALGVAIVLALLAERPTLSSLRLFFMTYVLRFATRTRPEIVDGYSFAAAFQYYLLPAVAIFAVVLFVARYLLGASSFSGHRDRLRSATLATVAAFALVMSVRSLERHSLIEGFQPYLFYLVVALLPLAVLGNRRNRHGHGHLALCCLLLVIVVRALITLPPFGFSSGYVAIANLGHRDEAFSFKKWEPEDERTLALETRHENLLQFLGNNLDDDQTFFDFTNSPLLYALAGRRFPTYIIPNLEQTADTIQELTLSDLEELREHGRLPFVIFKQGNHWDRSDGIANEVRSYRIAEWIYRHFRPLGTIDDYEIWGEPGTRHEDLVQIETPYEVPLRQRPRANDMARLGRGEDGQWRFRAGQTDPFVYRFAQLAAAPDISLHPHWRLRLHYRVEKAGLLEVYWRYGEQETFEQVANYQWSAEPTPPGVYLTSTMQLERERDGRELFELRIDPPKDSIFELARVEMVGIEPLWPFFDEHPIRQRDDLKSLATVWAELDAERAIDHQQQGPTLAAGELLRPGEWRLLSVPAGVAQKPAYLHLRLRTLATEELFDQSQTPYAKVLYERSSCCGHDFRLNVADGLTHDYLIRLSTQWRWWQEPVSELRLGTSRAIVIDAVRFLEGD